MTAQDEAQLDPNIRPGVWLAPERANARLARAEPREWLFPDTEDVFRSIYTRAGIGFTQEVVGICSAIPGEGRTTTSLGLAVTLAQDFPDARVLLVETDMQRPTLAQDFAVDPTPGLIECVVMGNPLQDACRPTFLHNLHLVPVGKAIPGSGRVLRSIRVASAIEAMRQSYDMVILDLPPLLVNSDAVLLTDLSDGVVCVVRSGVTPVSLVNKAIELLDRDKLRGVVLNGSASSIPGWMRRLCGV